MTRCEDDCLTPSPGTRVSHCLVCHRTFSAHGPGDRHRVPNMPVLERDPDTGRALVDAGGDPAALERRCGTDAELAARGIVPHKDGKWGGVSDGAWVGKLSGGAA